ncbi:unnamed protein product [Closterium sp. NIES-54]
MEDDPPRLLHFNYLGAAYKGDKRSGRAANHWRRSSSIGGCSSEWRLIPSQLLQSHSRKEMDGPPTPFTPLLDVKGESPSDVHLPFLLPTPPPPPPPPPFTPLYDGKGESPSDVQLLFFLPPPPPPPVHLLLLLPPSPFPLHLHLPRRLTPFTPLHDAKGGPLSLGVIKV